ncbi:MAG: hypothetical protein ACXWUP_06940, partial [Allosphingosinicella sp.]
VGGGQHLWAIDHGLCFHIEYKLRSVIWEFSGQSIVYGDDPCPAAADDAEIVVCARRPEEERYRIPEALRRSSRPAETSWTTRTEDLEAAQRDTRPDGCSVVGSFGQSGCTQQMVRDWYAERRLRRRTR